MQRPLTGAAALALGCAANPCFAQTATAQPAPSWTAETIVVTGKRSGYAVGLAASATRTPTPLIDTPQSIQVLNRTLIEEQDRRTLADVLVNVSGVTPSKPAEAVLTEPIVRGFPAEIFVDGLPAFGLSAVNDPASLVGAERIEVVKGPTSTLYGGGVGAPLGGLINIVSKVPGPTPGGFVALRGGSFGTIDPFADLNVPLGQYVRSRLIAEFQHEDSWIDRVRGSRLSITPSLALELGPRTELVLRGQYERRSQLEYSGLPAAAALAGQLDRDAFPGATRQPHTTIENRLVTADLRHGFSDAVELRVTGRYYASDFAEYGSFTFPGFFPPAPATPTSYAILSAYLPTRVKEGTFDANLLARGHVLGGQHELLAGVNYDRTSYDAAIGFHFAPLGTLDLAHPVYNVPFGAAPTATRTETDNYETIAGYVQDQASYGPLHLSGSLRYTHLVFRQQELKTDRTYDRVTPRVGATLDVMNGAALFAGYATGFRGSVNFIGSTPPVPETSRSVEGGVKLALKQAGLSGTLAVFETRRRNVPTADPAVPFASIQTGEQRARGVEADLVWEPSPSLSVLADYAYTDAVVTRDTTIPVGDRLPRVPEHSGRVAARYRLLHGPAKGLSFGAGVSAVGRREITLPNSIGVPGYAVMDAQASYDIGRVTISLSAANLTGERAYDPYAYLAEAVVIPVQPRSAYVTLKARF